MDTIKKVKRRPAEWEKIFAIYLTTELHPEYIKNCNNFITKKTKNYKVGQRSEHTFLQVRYTNGK